MSGVSGGGEASLSGRLLDGHHIFKVRVYFEDTDFSGVVYHTSYLRWCERGRSDYMRLSGISHQALASGTFTGEPSAFALRRVIADFVRPARIDEILEVTTRVARMTKASIMMRQVITREATAIVKLWAQCVLVSSGGRLLRLPDAMQAAVTIPVTPLGKLARDASAEPNGSGS